MGSTATSQKDQSVSILICGQAGQGIQTVEQLLTGIVRLTGYNVFATKEYMSRIRGGANSVQIRLSTQKVRAPVDKSHIVMLLDRGVLAHVADRIKPETLLLADRDHLDDDFDANCCRFAHVPLAATASEIGGTMYSNTIAVGMIAALLKIEAEILDGQIERRFSTKAEEIVRNNLKAAAAGRNIANELQDSQRMACDIPRPSTIGHDMLISGAQAVGAGAIAGGCNFIAAYPMSPATSVLVFLAQHAEEFGIIAEQAEDEIAAINMALGAWYAGARGLVSTSGGGFDLMTEGLSLAAMLELPVVVHLGQRPGPATGLPTRTEQGDLNLALYAGHGEFARAILTPGTIEDAFYLTQHAFNLADKFQIPVFILTDQYLMDCHYNTEAFDLSATKVDRHIVETTGDYQRYRLTGTGVSPRGVPGFGDGLVCVDSDEHDEAGHITEDMLVRTRMVDKRLARHNLLLDAAIPPELIGQEDYQTLVVCWGTTCQVVAEALDRLGSESMAALYFRQVYPLPKQTADYLKRAGRIVIIENNATCQLGRLIKLSCGIDIQSRILKYDGLAFTVEEVIGRLTEILKD